MDTFISIFGSSATYIIIFLVMLYVNPEFKSPWWVHVATCATAFLAACEITRHEAIWPAPLLLIAICLCALYSSIKNRPWISQHIPRHQ